MTVTAYPAVYEHLLRGRFGDLTLANLRLMLATDAYNPDPGDTWVSSVRDYEVTGPGYSSRGPALTGVAVDTSGGTGALLTCDDVVFTDAGFTARWAVVYGATFDPSTSPLIACVDLDGVEPDGQDLTVTFDQGVLLVGPPA